MSPTLRQHLADLRGTSRLAVDAIVGVTDLVEAVHGGIASAPTRLAGPIGGAVNGITALVYWSIRGVTRAVGGGLDLALGVVPPPEVPLDSPAAREALVAVLNGILGDHFAQSGNPLAVPMRLRRGGRSLELTRQGLAAALPEATPKALVLVHGLCGSDRVWEREGYDYGAALARDLGYTPVYLNYNSGLHVSANGRAFAALLEALVSSWPVRLEEVAILAHSMGGLVARSALPFADQAGHRWPGKLRRLVFLGTPHHGAPLERVGHFVHRLLGATPFTAPFTALGRVRSAGITDLRHGYVRDEDWRGHDLFAHRPLRHRPLPLPDGVACYAIAGTRCPTAAALRERLVGDGLVAVPSALGEHRDPRFRLAFPESHRWVAYGTGHQDLLGDAAVYARIRGWLAEPVRRRAARRPR